jgi:hypothetical protein
LTLLALRPSCGAKAGNAEEQLDLPATLYHLRPGTP